MPFQLRLSQADVDFLKRLSEASIDVTLIGGRAMIFYGMARETFDTDIVIDVRIGTSGAGRVLDTLASLQYQPYGVEGPLDEVSFLARTHVIFTRPDNMVDVWTKPAGWGLEMLGRRITARVEGLQVQLAHVDDLLRMKSALKRVKDREDLRFLKEIRREPKTIPGPMSLIEAELVIVPPRRTGPG